METKVENTDQVLIQNPPTPEVTDIQLDFKFAKTKENILKMFSKASASVSEILKSKEETPETPSDLSPEGEVQLPTEFKLEDQPTEQVLELSSQGVKKFILTTNLISIVQLLTIFIMTVIGFFGSRHRGHLTFYDILCGGALYISSTKILKSFKFLKGSKKVTRFVQISDTLLAYGAYNYAISCSSRLFFVFLTSLSVSLSIFILGSVKEKITQKKAFLWGVLTQSILMGVIYIMFSGKFGGVGMFEFILMETVLGYFSGKIAEERMKILKGRLEMKELSITYEDCVAIGLGANAQGFKLTLLGLVKSLLNWIAKF